MGTRDTFKPDTVMEAVHVMKNLKYLIGAASVAMLVATVASGPVQAQALMLGTAHDLKGNITAGSVEVCIFCHTPHDASATITPLWNRTAGTAGPYSMYDSTFSGSVENAQATSPEGVSLACLSCHDGSIAMESLLYDGGRTITAIGVMTGVRAVGDDGLQNDHPISITYDPVADTGGLNTVASITTAGLPLYSGSIYTNADQVECGTCHNPHEPTVANGGNAKFLRVDNTNSALCVTCHIK
jgi:predicted CXXCH cytochrome family protein